MDNRIPATLLVAALSGPSLLAQIPRLQATAAVPVGLGVTVPANFTVQGAPGAPFVLLADFAAGPALLAGTPLAIGLSPVLLGLAADQLNLFGSRTVTVPVPPIPELAGLAIYSQALFPSAAAPNGLFFTSNGESTILHGTAQAIVQRFDFPAASGFTGSFDANAIDVLRGTIRVRRVQPVDLGDPLETPAPGLVPGQAAPFGFPIQSPLDPRGCRTQFVYRAADLEADGSREVLTGAWWRLFDGQPALHDAFEQVAIRVGHSTVVPNFLIEAFSALPAFPASGLDSAFALNESSTPELVRTGSYTIDPTQLVFGLDGLGLGRYADWNVAPSFVYNGVDSLLLDVRTEPSATAFGFNGAQVYLPVPSDFLPAARTVARSTLPFVTIDPNAVTFANQRDNAIHDMVFEFTRIEATALSPFVGSGLFAPDYQPAVLAASTPDQSRIEIVYRGADDAAGTNATPFSPNVDIADGKPFVQYRITLIADLATGAVPSVDTLVIPVQ